MKQFFEVFLSVVIIMMTVTVASQGVLINQTISTAREYHNTIVEKIENSGLNEAYVDELVNATNDNTDYTLICNRVSGTGGVQSYHVQLKYPIESIIYKMFGGKGNKGTATIDGYASVGKDAYTVRISDEGIVPSEGTLLKGTQTTLYENGTLVISGDESESDSKFTLEQIGINRNDVKHLVITGQIAIPDECFMGCENLEDISLGSTTSIGKNAFSGCGKLTELFIPDTVKLVNEGAFSKLSIIYIARNEGCYIAEGALPNDCKKIYLN